MYRLFFGGEGGIRTLEPLLTVTRFPIVRARPATRLLRVSEYLFALSLTAFILYHNGFNLSTVFFKNYIFFSTNKHIEFNNKICPCRINRQGHYFYSTNSKSAVFIPFSLRKSYISWTLYPS